MVWELKKSTFWEKAKHQFNLYGKNHVLGRIQ